MSPDSSELCQHHSGKSLILHIEMMYSTAQKLYMIPLVLTIVPLMVLTAPLKPQTDITMSPTKGEVLDIILQSQETGNTFMRYILNTIIIHVGKILNLSV